jgi:hypothetical protein
MTVTIKNVSDKPVTFATVFVMAPYEKNGVRKQVNGRDLYANIELIYGEPPPMPGKRRSKPVALLMPGETADVLLDEVWRDQFYFRLRLEDSSTDIPELTLSVHQVAFLGDDDTMWMHGFWRRRDPKDPMSWLTIDDHARLNHVVQKPKFLGALKPGSNLGGRPYHTLSSKGKGYARRATWALGMGRVSAGAVRVQRELSCSEQTPAGSDEFTCVL